MLTGASFLTDKPPKIDGVVTVGEWNNASKMKLDYSYLLTQNDASHLYVLLDVIRDTSENVSSSEDNPWKDFFWLSFDVDLDGKITADEDVLFSCIPNTLTLGKAYYTRPGGTTGLYGTGSEVARGFGSSINSDTPHRIWELAINLQEINTVPHGRVRIGLRIHSQIPSFTEEYPSNYSYDFSNLMELDLGVTYEFVPEQTTEPSSEPEEIEESTETFELTFNGIVLIITGIIAVALIIITLWTRMKNAELQSSYKKHY